MVVLHSGLCNDRLFVWGETPEPYLPKVGHSASGRQKQQPRIYLYDLGHEALREVLVGVSAGVSLEKKDIERLAVWMPTRKNLPIPSPLIADPPTSRAKPVLTPWTIAAYISRPSGHGQSSLRVHG